MVITLARAGQCCGAGGVVPVRSDEVAGQGGLIGGRVLQLSLVLQDLAEITVSLGKIRIDAGGLPELGDRFIQVAGVLQGDSRNDVALGDVMFQRDRWVAVVEPAPPAFAFGRKGTLDCWRLSRLLRQALPLGDHESSKTSYEGAAKPVKELAENNFAESRLSLRKRSSFRGAKGDSSFRPAPKQTQSPSRRSTRRARFHAALLKFKNRGESDGTRTRGRLARYGHSRADRFAPHPSQ